jgi:hypothetical protein
MSDRYEGQLCPNCAEKAVQKYEAEHGTPVEES